MTCAVDGYPVACPRPDLVGRDDELIRLRAVLDRTLAGEPGLCLIAGEAGVGKTRLLAELARLAEQRGARVLTGGCLPLAAAELPFAPVIEALRGDESGLDLVPVGSPGATAQHRMFELFLGTLGRLARRQPVVLAVEDLHWADRSTLDLIAFLARNLRAERVLLVLTCRDHDLDGASDGARDVVRRLPELLRLRDAERIDLDRLTRAQTTEQLVNLLGTEPDPAFVDTVFSRSEGNPLVTEALARSPGGDPVPASLRDFVLGRLAALPAEAAVLLRVAAIAGRRVRHELLAALSGLPEPEMFAALRHAVEANVLASGADGVSYAFRHALIREVIYERILPAERRMLHARLATALEDSPTLRAADRAAHTAEVAYHWHAADDHVRALPAAVRAGFDAFDRNGFAEALRHLRRALDAWQRIGHPVELGGELAGTDRAAVETRAADAAHLLGEDDQAVALAHDALRRFSHEHDPRRAAELWNRIGQFHYAAGHREAAAAAFDTALLVLPACSATPEAARAMAGLAKIHVAWSDLDAGQRLAERAIAAAETAGDRRVEARARNVLGLALAHRGELAVGLAELERSLRLARELVEPDDVYFGYINTGYVLGLAARYTDAARLSLEGYREMRRLGLERQNGCHLQANAAGNLLSAGQLGAAAELLAKAEGHGTRGARAFPVLIYQARRQIWQGELDGARRRLAQAGRLVERGAVISWHRWYLELVAELAMWDGEPERARAAVRDGLRVLAGTDEERFAGPLVELGLRAEADLAERARAVRDEQLAAAAGRAADELLELVRGFRRDPLDPADATVPEGAAAAHTARAELARVHGAADPTVWLTAAESWSTLGKAYPAAYCTFRAAEARLTAPGGPAAAGAELLRRAHAAAARLEAHPLRAECERLATWHRVILHAKPAESPGPAGQGTLATLTAREREILALITAGATNREIATDLVISPKTASVHVSNILRKLGVSSRTDAARIGHRGGVGRD
ncbi:MAG TPA: AAA family ATPase [Actinophytocola sp.]|uniref:helix-turn-helix transcriptional regulator n=1 Tax=Actinophytocola sp. TaxID=1872138 RepID=UPI002DBB1F8C|nr:AAA family ATPase [Actinophytocola sp.]HEU5472898.1 AAA family ATPase [Actinophytocola sp.]